jgi:hypothetical protein
MPNLHRPVLVRFKKGFIRLREVNDKRPAIIGKVLFAHLCGFTDLLPVNLFFGVDPANNLFVRRHQLCDRIAIETDVRIDKHQVVALGLQKDPNQFVPRPGDQALVHYLGEVNLHPHRPHLVDG